MKQIMLVPAVAPAITLAAVALIMSLGSCQSTTTPAPKATTKVMSIKNNRIVDANGKPFVMRGVNLQYGDNPTAAFPGIKGIASTKANVIRIQFRRTTTPEQVKAAIEDSIAHKMIVMPMFWEDGVHHEDQGPTCSNSEKALNEATAKWTTDWRSIMQEPNYQPYLMLNIANEWGRKWNNDIGGYPMTYQDFIDYYKVQISKLRNAGYKMPLVIDAPQCGQDFRAFVEGRGKQLLEHDPEKNIVLSVHAYWSYHSEQLIDEALNALEQEDVPYIFGEFGNKLFQSTRPEGNKATQFDYLITRLNELKRGWIAWSWKGNGAWDLQETLDMSKTYYPATLTPHGQDIVNLPAGIKQTAKKASYW